jgi:cell wall-associated NlpC family hydrolase
MNWRCSRAGLMMIVAAIAVGVPSSRALAQEVPPIDSGTIDASTQAALDAGDASLADVEIYTGELHSDARDGEAELDGAKLMAAGALEVDPAAIQAAAKAAAIAQARAEAQAKCAMSAPPGTLRGGSERYGLSRICQESIAQAATPQAANAMLFMFANLGVPYSAPLRQVPGFFDCSSYAMSAYQAAGVRVSQNGIMPSTHSIAPHSGFSSYGWLKTVTAKNARPGDMFLWVPPERTGHVAVKLWGGFMIHTAHTGDVSHIQADSAYSPPAVIRRVIP